MASPNRGKLSRQAFRLHHRGEPLLDLLQGKHRPESVVTSSGDRSRGSFSPLAGFAPPQELSGLVVGREPKDQAAQSSVVRTALGATSGQEI